MAVILFTFRNQRPYLHSLPYFFGANVKRKGKKGKVVLLPAMKLSRKSRCLIPVTPNLNTK
jgi:hypothetical protein